MAQRHKRSISLPRDLDRAVAREAASRGTSVSAWIAETAERRLHLEAGRRAIGEWEAEHGPLTPGELEEGLARARKLIGRKASRRSPRDSA